MTRSILVVHTFILLAHAGCTTERESPATPPGATDGVTADSNADSGIAGSVTAQDTALRAATERIVAFLQGTADFDALSLADSVNLILPAEAGGARRRVARQDLRDRSAWSIDANGPQYSLIPPDGLSEKRIVPGRHINCIEGSLATRIPELAGSAHVGVHLTQPGAESCLQGWSATFAFDTTGSRHRLTDVVYDQWEW